MLDNCWLCEENRFVLNEELGLSAEETTVIETEKSITFIDLSPVKIGHLLTLPKRHVNKFKDIISCELNDIIKHLKAISKHYSGNCISYAHVNKTTETQCVDHIHFHSVPTDMNVVKRIVGEVEFMPTPSSENDILSIFQHGQILFTKPRTGNDYRKTIERLTNCDLRSWRSRIEDDPEKIEDRIRSSLDLFLKGENEITRSR